MSYRQFLPAISALAMIAFTFLRFEMRDKDCVAVFLEVVSARNYGTVDIKPRNLPKYIKTLEGTGKMGTDHHNAYRLAWTIYKQAGSCKKAASFM